jgi:hypothetical protein
MNVQGISEENRYSQDIRGISFDSSGSPRAKMKVSYNDYKHPDLKNGHPKFKEEAPKMSPAFLKFTEEFFKKARQLNYDPKVVVDGYGYSLEISTSNNVKMTIAGNKGIKLPSKFRVFISQASDDKLETKKQELYSVLRRLFTLDDTAFTQDGKKYFMDSGKPSLTFGGSEKDARLQEFFNVVPHVESMGNVSVRSSGSSKELVTRRNTPFRYYVGAAILIYTATRFGMPNLLGRNSSGGNEDSGTFDIKKELLTIGVTDAGMLDYNSNITPYYEHAVPVNVIKKTAIQMIKKYHSEQKDKRSILPVELILRIAYMIRRNLIIVRTGNDESTKILDKVHKDSMPENWDPIEGNPLQRFIDLGIKVYPLVNHNAVL